ncbi:MAG: prolyl oligopeptidase family serine peptidase [Planctomycetaceae bacterium]|nr:prolyl oligopeptidase family serine peptidase [Planctomycetaceae bacterium]
MKFGATLFCTPQLENGVRYKRPALVYFYGGFGLSPEDTKTCQKFVNDGFVVMLPQLRGEERSSFQIDKEGHYELLMGEVDDAVDAIRWLSKQNYVDSNQIFAFSHSIGGGISALLSLQADVPIRHSGSSGGLYSPADFKVWKAQNSSLTPDKHVVRFDPNKKLECQLRVLFGNIKWIQRRHIAYIGAEDDGFNDSVNKMTAEAKKEGKTDLLQIERPQGDYFTSLEPAIESYRRLIQSELGDDYAKPLEVKTDELDKDEKKIESKPNAEESQIVKQEELQEKNTSTPRRIAVENQKNRVKK